MNFIVRGQNTIGPNTSLLPLTLVGPPTMAENHLMSDENMSNMTLDEAIVRINQLAAENAQLKSTIQQTNSSMKMACESFAVLQEKARKEEEENLSNYNKSKAVVIDLRKKISEKDRIIDTLKKQINEDAATLESSDLVKQLQIENEKLMQDIQQMKAQITSQDRLCEESKALKMQMANLLTTQEAARQQFMQEKMTLQQKYMDLEKQNLKIKGEEQKKLEELQLQNNKLSLELQNVSKHYEQLMSDYHDLLTSNGQQKFTQDSQVSVLKKDFESRLDNLTAQLVTAEEVLLQKDEQIRTLHQKLNDLEPLQAQVAIYKSDFEAERKSREELNDRLLELTEKYQHLDRMPGRPPVPPLASPVHVNPPPLPPPVDPVPESELKCPICLLIAPDLDSLQLHVDECIERH